MPQAPPPWLRGATWNDNKRRRSRPLAVGALVTGLLAAGLGAAPAALAASDGPPSQVVVRAVPGHLAEAASSVTASGGVVRRRMAALDTLSASVPPGRLAGLRSARGVAAVGADAGVELSGDSYDGYNPARDPNSIYNSLLAMGAGSYYARGYTGRGVDVAVLDSGVSTVPGLDAPGKVVKGPDLTPESARPNLADEDTNGHGTFMAGLIAGGDTDLGTTNDGLANGSFFAGAAPGARVISVKAADAHGSTDVSQVLAGIDWVVQHRHDDGMNIRVLNLSFGTDSDQSYLVDPLAYAVETAWKKGIFVVVSAGNNGDVRRSLTNPATDPYVMAVGAEDTRNTVSRIDDVIPGFSSYGTPERSPDLVAPGKSVTSLRVPGSYVDTTYPSARVNGRFFRGSGTSHAAAYVSGAAALVMSQRPGITPDQLKDLLKRTATSLPLADDRAQGAGALDLSRAYYTATNPKAVQLWPSASGLGSLELSRGSNHVDTGAGAVTGETDVRGEDFTSATWAPRSAAGTSWSGSGWNGATWSSATWSSATWSSATWSSATWSSATWSGATWSSATWSSATWSSATWSSATWSSDGWG